MWTQTSQPTHRSRSISHQAWFPFTPSFISSRLMQSTGQTSRQDSQPVQLSALMTARALGSFLRGPAFAMTKSFTRNDLRELKPPRDFFHEVTFNYRWLSVRSQSREQRIRSQFRRLVLQITVNIDIFAQGLNLCVFQPQGRGNVADSRAADGGRGFFSAKQLGGDENVDFVDLPGIQQRAEELRAPFDQDVRHFEAA